MIILMIANEETEGWHYFAVKKNYLHYYME